MPGRGAPVRIGILGAARITPSALIKPGSGNNEVVVAAVAARDLSRAQAFAAKHGIARVHDSYEALIADPDLDAIYNPLPMACTASGLGQRLPRQARAVRKTIHRQCRRGPRGRRTGRQVRPGRDGGIPLPLPPLALRVEEIIASGELGKLERVEAHCVLLAAEILRHPLQLLPRRRRADGPGCYAVDMVRRFGGSTPEVVSAQAKLRRPEVDRAMTAELRFAGGHTGRIHCSMWSPDLSGFTAKVVGDHGELRLQSADHLSNVSRSDHQRKAGGEFPGRIHLCESARRFRRGRAAR